MRRASIILGVLVVVAAAFPSAAALSAGQPTRTPVDPASAERSWPAGKVCPFALKREPVDIREILTTFPAESNGDQTLLITGYAVVKFTNLETGKSVTVNVSGPLKIITHADGTARIEAFGPTSYELFVTDTPPGPDELLSVGRLIIDVNANGDYDVLSQTGRQVSICTALA